MCRRPHLWVLQAETGTLRPEELSLHWSPGLTCGFVHVKTA